MHTNRGRNPKRGLALLGCAVLVLPCWAQGTPPAPAPNAPAASPRPEELEPGVNTSIDQRTHRQPSAAVGRDRTARR